MASRGFGQLLPVRGAERRAALPDLRDPASGLRPDGQRLRGVACGSWRSEPRASRRSTAALFNLGPRLRASTILSNAVQRAPRARVLVPVGRGPEAPGK